MSERFSSGARQALDYTAEEAERLNTNRIDAVHMLLGLVRETDGVAARALRNLGVDLKGTRSAVESRSAKARLTVIAAKGSGMSDVRSVVQFAVGLEGKTRTVQPVLTARTKKAIVLAVEKADFLNHSHVGTEHLLLGLLREGNGVDEVLKTLGVSLDSARAETIRVLEAGCSSH